MGESLRGTIRASQISTHVFTAFINLKLLSKTSLHGHDSFLPYQINLYQVYRRLICLRDTFGI